MNRLPKVSIVMPVYNAQAYILQALESVQAQTLKDYELLIIDDGGTDNSIEICRTLIDPTMRIYSQQNRGLAGARNTGIRKARGEYIALLDADDRWHPRKLEEHVRHLDENPDVGVSYSRSRLIDDDGKPLGIFQRPKLTDITPRDIFTRNPVGNGSAAVVRAEAFRDIATASPRPNEFDSFDENFRQSEDIECWMRIATLTEWKFEGLGQDLTDYRINQGGLSANINDQFQSWMNMQRKIHTLAPDFVDEHLVVAEAFQLRYLARRAVQMHAPGGLALKLGLKAFFMAPLSLLREPTKTVMTLGAALAQKILPVKSYAWLEARLMNTPSMV
jgi:glycosyltransferase involved in cell wall biosynthesis